MSVSPKSRLVFIDLLKGWALIVMIEVHVFNAFILPEFKMTQWFNILNFINGLVAPSFIFISGFVFIISSHKKIESYRTFNFAFWKQLARISLIWIVGYFLHLPKYSYSKMIETTSTQGWLKFYQADVLHCIAFGLLIIFVLRLIIKNNLIYKNTLLCLAVTISVATLFLWNIDFTLYVFPQIAAYINSQHYSLFPIFPWLAFMLFGGYFACMFLESQIQNKESNYIKKIFLLGLSLLIVSAVVMECDLNIIDDVRANPFFFYERLGIVMVLFVICYYYAKLRQTENSIILDVSRESLFVYAAHLLIIYGQFFNGSSLAYYYGKKFDILECIVATIFLIFLMIYTAKLWGWLKLNNNKLAKIIFYSFWFVALIVFMIL